LAQRRLYVLGKYNDNGERHDEKEGSSSVKEEWQMSEDELDEWRELQLQRRAVGHIGAEQWYGFQMKVVATMRAIRYYDTEYKKQLTNILKFEEERTKRERENEDELIMPQLRHDLRERVLEDCLTQSMIPIKRRYVIALPRSPTLNSISTSLFSLQIGRTQERA
jgi:hypothetical protein